MSRLLALGQWLRRRWTRVLLWTLLLGAATYLGLRRGQVGVHPSEVSAFQAVSLAPLMPLPDAPYPISAPGALNGRQEVVICLFVDGLERSIFEQKLAAGELPNLSRLLAERPGVGGAALGTFPTSTAPAISEFLTGTWSHHIHGGADKIHAFDRQEQRLIRYEVESRRWDGDALTLFDRITAEGGESLSYFEGYFPGASLNVHEEFVYLLDIAEERTRITEIMSYDQRVVRDLAARLSEGRYPPQLVFLRFGGADSAGHFYGPSSPEYAAALQSVDARVGEIRQQLSLARLPDGRSLADIAHFVLFSDHGMTDTRAHIDLDAALRRVGLSPWPTSDPRAVLRSTFDPGGAAEHDIVAVPGGSNLAFLYLRARSGSRVMAWNKATDYPDLDALYTGERTIDLPGALLEVEGVSSVIWAESEHQLRLQRPGRPGARLWRRLTPEGTWRIAYQPDAAEDDPFGYCAAPGRCCPPGEPGEACFLTVDQWEAATADDPLPLAPFFLFKSFSGEPEQREDLIVTAEPGYGFMRPVRGDHGALAPNLLRVPLYLAGPRIRPGASLAGARLIDVAPTLLQLWGLPCGGCDGRALDVLNLDATAER